MQCPKYIKMAKPNPTINSDIKDLHAFILDEIKTNSGHLNDMLVEDGTTRFRIVDENKVEYEIKKRVLAWRQHYVHELNKEMHEKMHHYYNMCKSEVDAFGQRFLEAEQEKNELIILLEQQKLEIKSLQEQLYGNLDDINFNELKGLGLTPKKDKKDETQSDKSTFGKKLDFDGEDYSIKKENLKY